MTTDKLELYKAAQVAVVEYLAKFELSVREFANEDGCDAEVEDSEGNKFGDSMSFTFAGEEYTIKWNDWTFGSRYYADVNSYFTFDETDGYYLSISGYYDSWNGTTWEGDLEVSKRIEHVEYSFDAVK